MKKEQILREELARMRQLMGMSGQLYQKPIMDEDAQRGVEGHMATAPDPRSYRGGERSSEYVADSARYTSQHRAPAPTPAPAPKVKSAAKDFEERGKSGKSMDGEFTMPMGSIPGMSTKRATSTKRGKSGRSVKKGAKKVTGRDKGSKIRKKVRKKNKKKED
tara:strand:- start:224 stop:709 length:486 start_codon:yes stop_codon:yes gene_type:complete